MKAGWRGASKTAAGTWASTKKCSLGRYCSRAVLDDGFEDGKPAPQEGMVLKKGLSSCDSYLCSAGYFCPEDRAQTRSKSAEQRVGLLMKGLQTHTGPRATALREHLSGRWLRPLATTPQRARSSPTRGSSAQRKTRCANALALRDTESGDPGSSSRSAENSTATMQSLVILYGASRRVPMQEPQEMDA